jgi:hydroxymethylpyrimidine pyrophosphatase-like HAD family hydrolase
MNKIKIVFTDFDGTLFSSNRQISETDRNTLVQLGDSGIIRVIATGRSVFSINKIINIDFPIDYLIFSSGSGILEWKSKKILLSHNLNNNEIIDLTKILRSNQVDFMIHDPIPENHRFRFFQFSGDNPDFSRRCEIYKEYTIQLTDIESLPLTACQFVGIINNDLEHYDKIRKSVLTSSGRRYEVIRTTSPLNGESIWVEIFPENVSKGNAARWLCNYLSINQSNTLGIGNDYNDLDLLYWTKFSFIANNSPKELQHLFNMAEVNTGNEFTNAVNTMITI